MKQIEFNVPLVVNTEVVLSVSFPLFLSTWSEERNEIFAIVPHDLNSRWNPFRIIEIRQYGDSWKIYESLSTEKNVGEILARKHTGELMEITRTEFIVLFNEAIHSYQSLINLI